MTNRLILHNQNKNEQNLWPFFASYPVQISNTGISVSVAGPATALYIIIPALLGVLLLKETMTRRKGLGIALAVLAIYLLSDGEFESWDILVLRGTPQQGYGVGRDA